MPTAPRLPRLPPSLFSLAHTPQVPAFGWFRYLNLALLGLVAVLYVVLLIPVLGSRRRLARTASARLQRLNSPLRIGVGLLLGLVFCVLGELPTLHRDALWGLHRLVPATARHVSAAALRSSLPSLHRCRLPDCPIPTQTRRL